MKMKFFIAGFLAMLFIAGCSEDSTNEPVADGDGFMKIYMVDDPAEYDSVIVSVVSVEVHSSNSDTVSGWFTINNEHRYFDLLQLMNGANAVLGDTALPPGDYQQIRLLLDNDNYLIDSSGHRYDLDVPSGQQTGIKLNHNFTIESGKTYLLMLDFNVHKSIIQTGNGQYKLKPVIRLIPMESAGNIGGIILPADAFPVIETVVGADTVVTYASVSGGFVLPALPAGSYNIEIEPDNELYRDTVITGINVIAGQTTDIGTVNLNTN